MGRGAKRVIEAMKNYEVKTDKKIAFAAFYYFLASAINSTIKVVIPSATAYGGIISAMAGVSIFFFFAMGLPAVWRRSKRVLIKSYIIFGVLYFISIALSIFRGDPINLIISGSAFLTFAWWIPVGVYSCSVSDPKVLYEVFLKGSYYLSAVLLIMFVFHPLNVYGETGYNMYFGTTIIIPALFHLNEIIRKKKLFVLLFFIIELAAILIYANRGVLASILFLVMYVYFFRSKNVGKKVVSFVVIGLVALLLLVFQDQILNYLLAALEGFGIQSRTLSMMLGSSFMSDSSNRDLIWDQSIHMIEQRPLFGWGLGGEFYEMARLSGDADIIDNSFNAHNAFLQNFVNFGILGGLIASLIFIKPYFGMRRIKDTYLNDMILVCGAAIIPCFISAAGLFVKPLAAIFIYLYYMNNHCCPEKFYHNVSCPTEPVSGATTGAVG